MSTLAEIETAAAALPRPELADLLNFVASRLREGAPPAPRRTGGELARLWSALPHLSADEAAEFERDLAMAHTSENGQAAPKWE